MISLRDITTHDRELIRQWRNQPEIRKQMYTDHEISADEHCVWFSRILENGSCKYWIIVCDGQDAGLVYVSNIDLRNRRCSWGFYAIEACVKGKGAGRFAEFTVLRYVFEELKLEKLCCEVLASNQVVINMHKKFGFAQEGLFRKHVRKGDDFADVVCLAMLHDEWQTKKIQLEVELRAKGIL